MKELAYLQILPNALLHPECSSTIPLLLEVGLVRQNQPLFCLNFGCRLPISSITRKWSRDCNVKDNRVSAHRICFSALKSISSTHTNLSIATNSSNMTSAYEKYKRIVNNVTLSMPHAGVFAAARASKNCILQPEELAGVGSYNIEASVISPTVNVLCANMNKTEIAPLIYTTWPHATLANSSSMPGQAVAWPGYQDDIQLIPGQDYLNSTAADDVFEWGAKYKRQPPIFPMVSCPRLGGTLSDNSSTQSNTILSRISPYFRAILYTC